MKKLITLLSIFLGLTGNAQVLGYSDFGILLSDENIIGTARSMALKNSFGALGGDLSAISINPAGAAVYTTSSASFSLGYNTINLDTDFYGTTVNNTTDSFNLMQAGGLLLFEGDDSEALNKITFSLNYQVINNFKNNWIASGRSIATWLDDPSDDTIIYNNLENQTYKNYTSGKHGKLNIAMAGQFNEDLYLGFAFNSNNVDFKEESSRHEISNDGNGNSVDAYESFWQEVTADGFSLSVGLIYKLTQNFRVGLAYTSPTWFKVYEESNMFAEDDADYVGYYNVLYSNDPPAYENNQNKVLAYEYNLRTPSKTTASLAYVFGKSGLVSADLSRKNYKGIHLNPNPDFSLENSDIDTYLNNTYTLSMGTEWRIENLSLRGGYSYETSPYSNTISTDNPVGFSFGVGYNFETFSIDVAYDHRQQTDIYDFYPEFETISPANLSFNDDKILATLVIKL